MKVYKILSPSHIFCDNDKGTIKIQSIDGASIFISGLDFNNWESKFDTILIMDNKVTMSKVNDTNPSLPTFFSHLTNLIHGSLKDVEPDEIEDRCQEIFNVVLKHIRGDI